ncbi:MAG TPA: hypothetical protein VGR29_00505, partial [Thermomicrobiales bacterium]|nr:hypothetical protein [Thermomicrobiales bacterium]
EGDVIEPDDGVVAIGSGAPFATAAAKALITNTDMPAEAIVRESMRVTAEICIFTNDRFTVEVVRVEDDKGGEADEGGA